MNTKGLILVTTLLLFLAACTSTNQGNSNLKLTDVEFLISNNPNSEDVYSFKATVNASYEGELLINIYQAEALLVSNEQFSTTIDFYRLRFAESEGEMPDRAEAVFKGEKIWEGTPQVGSRF